RKPRYSNGLQLPDMKRQPPVRDCIECGRKFTPVTSEVMTCGRTCGAKSMKHGARRVQPVCPRCAKPFTSLTSGRGICRACIAEVGSVQAILRNLGVLGSKHIPAEYLRAAEPQRRALLAGLLDTDGTATRFGSVQFAVTSRRLAEDFRELVTSLGYRCGWHEKPVRGQSAETSTAYVLTFTTSDDVFRLTRKRAVHQECRPENS